MVSRRRFLLVGLGVGSAVGVAVAPAGASTAAADTAMLWRLSADWGYPAGPKGRTRCKGRACHLNAANKIFATRDAAIGGRLHPCCVAQPVAFEVPVTTYRELTTLPPGRGTSLADRRHAGVSEILARGSSTTLTAEGPAAGSSGLPTPPSPSEAGRRSTRPPAQLASTGASSAAMAAGATALGAVGMTALVISRRNAVDGDDAS